MVKWLAPFLQQQGYLVLDGGLATELEARGYDLAHRLWSARLLDEDPNAIRRLHFDYLEAGADCIISASYQATLAGFQARGVSEAEAIEAIGSSVSLAVQVTPVSPNGKTVVPSWIATVVEVQPTLPGSRFGSVTVMASGRVKSRWERP